MIPACSAVPRKLDKLTVLKMAVEHVKALRGGSVYIGYHPSYHMLNIYYMNVCRQCLSFLGGPYFGSCILCICSIYY